MAWCLGSFTVLSYGRDLPNVYSRMEIAQQEDSVAKPATLLLPKSRDERVRTMTINFVLLRSSLLASRDSDTIVVSRE
jgi:hypothetical protein